MGQFLETEKQAQMKFRAASPFFTNAARAGGVYRGKERPFCVPLENARENLFLGIRESLIDYFTSNEIKWHDGHDGNPSNHLCDSQVCCVNFLSPFAGQPDALAGLLRPLFPSIHKMLPIEAGQYVAFEWIGRENYLNEKVPRHGRRTRGANCTSADAAVLFEQTDGKRQIVLIEWKYTESYTGDSLEIAKSGTDRTRIYKPIFDREDCPINKDVLPSFKALFYEPFYQLMRQQFLAHEMELKREKEADIVSVLHISPAHNRDFKKVTSEKLVPVGPTPIGIWKKLVRPRTRFHSIDTEQLFGKLTSTESPEMREWLDYIHSRYAWVREMVEEG